MKRINNIFIVGVIIALVVGGLIGYYPSASKFQSNIDSLQNKLNILNEEKQAKQWSIKARDALIIGEYGNNFAYDGNKVRPVEGDALIVVDSDKETGSVVATIKNAKHQFSKDEILEGEIKLVMNKFIETKPFMQGGVAENLFIHGDTGQGPPVMPKQYTFLAGWGPIDLYVDGKLIYEGLDGHFMYTERARVDGKIIKNDGTIYSPKIEDKTGFTDSSSRELHIVAHTTEEDKGNFPPHTKWIHLNFQDVVLTKAPERANLFVSNQ